MTAVNDETTDVSLTDTGSGELFEYAADVARQARQASEVLRSLPTARKNSWLLASADAILASEQDILAANVDDLDAAPQFGLSGAAVDRLRLDRPRIECIAQSLREIAALPDPIGEVIEGFRRPNGLEIQKVRVPIGTVFFIYESRPNVTADAAAICIKSGNAVILRGGKEAWHSSTAIAKCLSSTAVAEGIPEAAIQILTTTDRAAVGHFLAMPDLIDVAIPRGGRSLIERVVSEAKMPVIKHYDGNCHVYLDATADPELAVSITVNSKCQRMGVCNACESLLVHREIADSLLPRVSRALLDKGVELRGDAATCKVVPDAKPASEEDWGREYLGPVISVKVVESLESAIAHINHYGSHHTDAIVTNSVQAARKFQVEVDSSVVLLNASTRFNDGGQFGFGAEIGISTDKLHARGPCGIRELTTYKYLVSGDGQIRE